MKKEKQVKSYQRRTKSGKMVTVRAHTATYDAADKAKEAAKKKGAGKELEERMTKKPAQLEIPFDKEEEKKVLDEVKETAKKESSKKPAEKKTTKKKSDSVVYKHKYGPKGNGDPKRSAENNAAASIRESSAAKDALRSSDATTFEQFKRTKGYRDLSPAAKEWAHYYRNGGWLKNFDTKEKPTKKVRPVGSGTNGPVRKTKEKSTSDGSSKTSAKSSEPAFTAAEFKEWYRGTGSAADKKVAKALRAQLGRSGYKKLEDEAIDNYSSRGHLSMFKRVGGGGGTPTTKSPSKRELLKRTAEMHKREKAFEKGPRKKADAPIKASTSDEVKKAIKNTYSGFLGGKAAKDAISTLEKNGFKKKQIYSDGNYKQNVYVSPDGKSGYFSDGTTLSIASRSQINAKPKTETYFRKSSDVPRNVTNAVNKIYRYINSKAAAEELSKLPDKDYNKVASGDTKALASLYKKHLKINKLKPVHMELVEKISKSLSKKK